VGQSVSARTQLFLAPLVFHDATTGHLFARSSWDEDAIWVGYFDELCTVSRRQNPDA